MSTMATKVCRRCNITQPLNKFSTNNRNKDKLESMCRECNRKKYLDNQAANLAARKRWREKNPQYQKEWQTGNTKFRAYQQAYYAGHRDTYIARKQQWRRDNPAREAAARTAYNEKNRDKLTEYRRSAE